MYGITANVILSIELQVINMDRYPGFGEDSSIAGQRTKVVHSSDNISTDLIACKDAACSNASIGRNLLTADLVVENNSTRPSIASQTNPEQNRWKLQCQSEFCKQSSVDILIALGHIKQKQEGMATLKSRGSGRDSSPPGSIQDLPVSHHVDPACLCERGAGPLPKELPPDSTPYPEESAKKGYGSSSSSWLFQKAKQELTLRAACSAEVTKQFHEHGNLSKSRKTLKVQVLKLSWMPSTHSCCPAREG